MLDFPKTVIETNSFHQLKNTAYWESTKVYDYLYEVAIDYCNSRAFEFLSLIPATIPGSNGEIAWIDITYKRVEDPAMLRFNPNI